jgi:hypothetical protein
MYTGFPSPAYSTNLNIKTFRTTILPIEFEALTATRNNGIFSGNHPQQFDAKAQQSQVFSVCMIRKFNLLFRVAEKPARSLKEEDDLVMVNENITILIGRRYQKEREK